MYTAEDILQGRERRIEFQEKLVQKYKMPILVIRVNYPGLNKDNRFSQEITVIIEQMISEMFSYAIQYKIMTTTAEGPLVIMCINKNARDIKSTTLDIEDKHLLGRCVDIDVYDENGRGISREEFGLGMRKCYICDDIAHNCVRSKKHSFDEVEGFIKRKFAEYMEKFYGK
ncbi:citrate lyase holo-[acyl-carrier protein] synthase [Clostridium estertheticum]|uniref:citrate lyase holo-[acyl-carrier protein] synthase n=1 Tax=Clostridium estertheticum TaxID=238834 RepID=UPI001CD125C6|nr:citrate lyase holo-[acyl-carrier protein] synthase [Clostridium estertheticum]MBZ9689422.1 citrate lyase holo-[acyl-carrier protein] synthase [Clostridium estertheticum]